MTAERVRFSKPTIVVLALALFMLWGSPCSAVVLFSEDFNTDTFPYNFTGHKFGYSDNLITTYHDSSGGVDDSGCHRIPLGGSGRTNFDVHFEKYLGTQTDFYVRYYLYVSAECAERGRVQWDGAGDGCWWMRSKNIYIYILC